MDCITEYTLIIPFEKANNCMSTVSRPAENTFYGYTTKNTCRQLNTYYLKVEWSGNHNLPCNKFGTELKK